MTAADLAHPLFLDHIAPRHKEHVKKLDLTHAHAATMEKLLPALVRLPGPFESFKVPDILDVIRTAPTRTLRGASASSDLRFVAFEQVAKVFASLLQRTTRANFAASAVNTSLFTILGANVTSLELVLSTGDGIDPLLAVMADCPALTSLEIFFDADPHELGARVPADIHETLRAVPLKHLRLIGGNCTAALHRLAAVFSPTLEHLELRFYEIRSAYNSETQSFLPARQYPKLRHLDVSGDWRIGLCILEGTSLANFPAMERLTVSTPGTEGRYNITSVLDRYFQSVLDRFAATARRPLEVSFCYESSRGVPETVLPAALHATAPLRLVASEESSAGSNWPDEVFTCPGRSVKDDSADLDEAHRAIDESLSAMRVQADWARRTGDRVQLAEMAEALQEWEALRYRWRT